MQVSRVIDKMRHMPHLQKDSLDYTGLCILDKGEKSKIAFKTNFLTDFISSISNQSMMYFLFLSTILD